MYDLLELTGTARQRGQAHGESLRQEIQERIAITLKDAPAPDSAPWWNEIGAAAPAIADEMTGIAEGAGCSVEDVVLLNVFEVFSIAKQAELGAGGCTVFGIPRAGRGPILAQNWDAKPSAGFALLRPHLHKGPDTLATLVLASPGGVGWIGINEAGVALVNADLYTRGLRVGVPSTVMRRLMLAGHNRSEGLSQLKRFGAVGGRTYLLGDLDGADLVEVHPEESAPVVLPPTEYGWVHANHSVTTIARFEDESKAPSPSSHYRYPRACDLMKNKKPTSTEQIKELLVDHGDSPYSICAHETEHQPTITAAAAIFDTEERRASIALGNPCTATFHDYTL